MAVAGVFVSMVKRLGYLARRLLKVADTRLWGDITPAGNLNPPYAPLMLYF
jgi:hypothetical protein